MKDSNEKELEVGQRVVVNTTNGLKFGSIIRLRTGKRYGTDIEIARVLFEVPVPKYSHGHYLRDGANNYITDENNRYIWVQGEVVSHQEWIEVHYNKKILIV